MKARMDCSLLHTVRDQNVKLESRSPVTLKVPGARLACTALKRLHHRNRGKNRMDRKPNRVTDSSRN
jgi:hypothetical protein